MVICFTETIVSGTLDVTPLLDIVDNCIDQNRLDGCNVRSVAMEYIENKTFGGYVC